MTLDEANTLLADLDRGFTATYSSPERAVIGQVYYEVLGRRLRDCTCPDKWRDAIIEIKIYIKKHGKMKEKSKYRLRTGVILQVAGSSQVYTNDNLTDEIAAKYLEENPNAAMRFEVIPTEVSAENSDGNSTEKLLADANTRIAELETEAHTHESTVATLQARIAELEAVKVVLVDNEISGAAIPAPENGEGDGDPDKEIELNEAVKKAIAAELKAGKSKTAVKAEFAGREIDGVKLTHCLVAAYIDIIIDAKE